MGLQAAQVLWLDAGPPLATPWLFPGAPQPPPPLCSPKPYVCCTSLTPVGGGGAGCEHLMGRQRPLVAKPCSPAPGWSGCREELLRASRAAGGSASLAIAVLLSNRSRSYI